MIPDIEPSEVRYPGERLVFRWLKSLPKDFTVFHSVRVLERLYGGRHREREADFVVLHPRQGLLVIEVKGGRDFELRDGQWWRGRKRLTPQPDVQAQEVMHVLKDWLAQRQQGHVLPHAFAICFPEVRYQGEFPPGLVDEQVLDHRLGHDVLSTILAAYRSLTGIGGVPLQALTDQAIQLLGGLVSTFVPLGMELEDVATRQWLLDELQLEALHVLLKGGQRLLVEGGAGTGKTELALAAAVDRVRRGERVLLTCFNRALARWLDERVAAAPELEGLRERLVVRHVHGLASDLSSAVRIPYAHDKATVGGILLEASMLEGDQHSFDAIVVDEGQDFERDWYLGLLELLREEDGGFYVFLDRRQQLWPVSGLADDLALDRTLTLGKNYRNTRRITGLLQRVEPEAPPAASVCPAGPEPVVQRLERASLQRHATQELVRRLLSEEGRDPDQLVCLSPRSGMGSLEGIGRIAGARLTEDAEVWRRGGAVLVTTARSFKGLEAEVVVLFDVDGVDGQAFSRTDLYVACSRARGQLFVVATGAGPQELRA